MKKLFIVALLIVCNQAMAQEAKTDSLKLSTRSAMELETLCELIDSEYDSILGFVGDCVLATREEKVFIVDRKGEVKEVVEEERDEYLLP